MLTNLPSVVESMNKPILNLKALGSTLEVFVNLQPNSTFCAIRRNLEESAYRGDTALTQYCPDEL